MATHAVSVQPHPSSVAAYIRHNWSLISIPPGTKGPLTIGWNHRGAALRSQADLPAGYGIGLAHAYSGTMALDIDDWDRAAPLLALAGVDLHALYAAPDAVVIDSGRQGHGKLLYAMPFGLALPTRKVHHEGRTVYEMRCATAEGLTVQDVLPPTVHPDTKQPYRWAGAGHWTRLPTVPQALLDLWQALLSEYAKTAYSLADPVDVDWTEVQRALACIPADCPRKVWIDVGMALHSTGDPRAFPVWDTWSATSTGKYPGEREMAAQWASFKPKLEGITIGTLWHHAREHGYTPPPPDVASLFPGNAKCVAPLDVLDGLRPKAPSVDASLWPDVLRTRALEVADGVGCDPLIPLFAGLAAVCAVVDARTRLELMPGFKVPPVLWLMTIGDPGDRKSPGSKPMLAPLRTLEGEDRPRHAADVLAWEGREAAYASAKKSFLDWSASGDALLGASAPPVPDLPPAPVCLRLTITDITSQKVVRMCADRPRGVLCYLDEMSSWMNKLVDKANGDDRSAWVASYESDTYNMDRVAAGSIHCENYAVSIYGNAQPQVFKAVIKRLSTDGLLQRFIPAVLRAHTTRLGEPVPECMTSVGAWEGLLRLVYALPAQTYRLSTGAHAVYRAWQVWYESARVDERVSASGPEYMTAFGKLEGLCGRLCLLWHVIESPWSTEVSADVVERVVDLMRGYVIPAYRYALGEVGGLIANDFEQWMLDHIVHISGDTQIVDLRGLKRSARRPLEDKTDWQRDQAVLDAMHVLEQAGWVSVLDGADLNKRRVSWAINPALAQQFKGYRERVVEAKQRHNDYIYRHAITKGAARKLVRGGV